MSARNQDGCGVFGKALPARGMLFFDKRITSLRIMVPKNAGPGDVKYELRFTIISLRSELSQKWFF